MTRPIALTLTLAALLSATEARAGGPFHRGRARPIATTYQTAPASYAPTMTYASPVATPARVYPYSYYASGPLPARTYEGYGSNDFPFYGVPYGHPYDPWTWPYLSGSYNRSLARYYDPPVK